MNKEFDQSEQEIVALLKKTKQCLLLTPEERVELRVKLIDNVTKTPNMRYKFWLYKVYKLNIKGVTMPLIPIIIAVLLAGGVGTAALADTTKPGDLLYPVDQYMEQIQERISMSEPVRARFWARVSNERADELLALRKINPANLSEQNKEILAQHQEKAVERLAIGIERVEAIQAKFQEKMATTDNESTQAAFQKVLTNLEEVKNRREARIEAIETGEYPGNKGVGDGTAIAPMPIRSQIQLWKNVSPELRTKIHEQVTKEFVGKPIMQGGGRVVDGEQTDSHQIQSQIQGSSGIDDDNF